MCPLQCTLVQAEWSHESVLVHVSEDAVNRRLTITPQHKMKPLSKQQLPVDTVASAETVTVLHCRAEARKSRTERSLELRVFFSFREIRLYLCV